MRKFFLCIFILLLGLVALAQQKMPAVYQIKADTAKHEFEVPDSCWQILEDPAGKLTISDVNGHAYINRFHENRTRTKGYDYHITHYWLRYAFKNTLDHPVKLYLKETVAYAYLYTRKANGTWAVQTNGIHVPFLKRDGIKRFPGFIITIDPGQTVTYYENDIFDFWIDKPKSFIMYAAFADPLIERDFVNNDQEIKTYLNNAFVFGLVIMAAIFNLLFYRVVRERTYLYFSLFLICMGSYMFLNSTEGYYIIAAGHWRLLRCIQAVLFTGFFFFLMQFVRSYLSTARITPRLDKWLFGLSGIMAFMLLAFYFIPSTLNYHIYELIDFVSSVFSYIYFPLILGVMLYYLRKNKLARLGIVATLPMMCWMGLVYTYMFIVQLLYQRYKIPYSWFYQWAVEWNAIALLITLAWLSVLFSWILFKRYSDLQKSLVQASLDREVERNQLIAGQNALLEQQVAARTADLTQANASLSEQREEITAQRDQLSDALTELRGTQQQLIQSAKMASLGELTAGIAHEIQNPLNFINNFSEVNTELIDELYVEMDNADYDEVRMIAGNIKENQQKISNHGKRADGIVKSMLQHSRASSGEKELRDINVIADEYLRLAYHGLRAKDKSFQTELNTEFDKELPSVPVVAQDIGRVLLNLFNNAFYAIQQKQSLQATTYKPKITVRTSLKGNFVSIVVIDNGIGIPEHLKEKIMQPFFTTKPTGDGTGLGLSLSYDIVVKGHQGRLYSESTPDEFTMFEVLLPLTNYGHK